MVQINLSVVFILAVAAAASVVALPVNSWVFSLYGIIDD